MIIDVTGVELIPGNGGADCPGNGECVDQNGNKIECCCDECDYMICCLEEMSQKMCHNFAEYGCPHISDEQML